MCLNTIASVRLVKPKVNVRAHKGIVRKLLEAACWVIALGLGQPTLYNDEVAIPALVKTGIRLEDTREYSNDGCTDDCLWCGIQKFFQDVIWFLFYGYNLKRKF